MRVAYKQFKSIIIFAIVCIGLVYGSAFSLANSETITAANCKGAMANLSGVQDVTLFTQQNPEAVLANLKKLSVSQPKRFAAAKVLAESHPKEVALALTSLKLNSSQRRTIGMIIAQKDLEVFFRHRDKFSLSSAERFAVARIAVAEAKKPLEQEKDYSSRLKTLLSRLDNLNLTSFQRYQAILELSRATGESFAIVKLAIQNMAKLGLTQTYRFQLAKQLGAKHVIPHIKLFDLSVSQRLELAKHHFDVDKESSDNTKWVCFHLADFEFAPKEQKALFQWARENHPQDLHFNMEYFTKVPDSIKSDYLVFYLEQTKGWGRVPFYTPRQFILGDPKHNDRIALRALELGCDLAGRHCEDNKDRGFLTIVLGATFTRANRMKILREAAQKKVFESPEELAEVKGVSERERLKLLEYFLEAHSNKQWEADKLEAYLALIPKHRKAAILLLAKHGQDVSPYLSSIRLTRSERYNLLFHSCENHPQYVGTNIRKYDLTGQERFNLAKRIAEADGNIISEHILSFSLTEAQRVEVAKIALNQSRQDRVTSIEAVHHYDIQTPALRFELAKALVKARPESNVVLRVSEALVLSRVQTRRLERIPFSLDPITHLEEAAIDMTTSSHVEDPAALAHLKRKMRAFARENPDILPPEWVPILWDRVEAQETGLRLMRLMYQLTDYDVTRPLPKDSLDIIATAMGFDGARLKAANLSSDRMGSLYWLSLDIRENLSESPFAGVSIEAALYDRANNRKLLQFLQRARDLHHLQGNSRESWKSVISELGLRETGLNLKNIADVNKRTEDLVVKNIQELFKTENMSITYEQLSTLEDMWGDIEPIITLLARFQGKPIWRNEIPELAAVFEASLHGRFEQMKFEGKQGNTRDIEAAQAQTAVLSTPAQKEAWRKARSRLSVYDPAAKVEAEASAAKLDAARRIVNDELMLHLPWEGEIPEAAAILDAVHKQQNPMTSLRELLEGPLDGSEPAVQKGKIVLAIARRLKETSDVEEAKKLAKTLRIWGNDLVLPADVVNDASAILRNIGNGTGSTKKQIIFSTTSHHPKILLMIGNLVGSRTCQSYSDGGYIQTLLGYVKDANVQAFGSWALNQSHFAHPKEFDRVVQAIEKGAEIDQKFDGGKRIATFKFTLEGTPYEIRTQPLGDAYLRNMIKLGATEGNLPGIAYEPAKTNHHDAMTIMDEHADSIKHETARAIGGVTGQKITVVKSRNAGGHYSDRSGGVKTGDYVIEP